jgi:hypothetical protein
MTPGGRPGRTMVAGLVILVGALVGFLFLLQEWRTADVSGGWPQTTGTITTSSLSASKHLRSGHETWTVHVAYSFSVGGKAYRGSVIHLGGFPSYDSKAEAHAVQARFADGATVAVFYDPGEPSNAVLERGMDAAAGSLGVGALLVGLVTALGAVVVFQSYRRMRRAKLGVG